MAGGCAIQGRATGCRRGPGPNDLDETLTAVAPVLTPPMQQAQAEVPSVEGDRTAVQERCAARAGRRGQGWWGGTEVGRRGPAQGGQPARHRRDHRPAGEFLVFGQAAVARPAAGQRAATGGAAVETARTGRAVV